jgi:hypothetical protein
MGKKNVNIANMYCPPGAGYFLWHVEIYETDKVHITQTYGMWTDLNARHNTSGAE